MKPESYKEYIAACESLINLIWKVDKDTTWEPTEPQWWLDMQEHRRFLSRIVQKAKSA